LPAIAGMHRVILDTNTLIFALLEPARLPDAIAKVIKDPENSILFSAASIWEIAIKAALGRASFKRDPSSVVEVALTSGFAELHIRSDAAIIAAALPVHHKDPFDRILVAQAICEPASLLTSDRALVRYSELVYAFDPL
jgi:PIN domain nuclease of toxin-antitoxin system